MPQLRFSRIRGVVRCVVGYTGGQQENPTYRSIKDHTQALLIEFDPSIVGYDELLIEWTRMHDPRSETTTRYRSAVWYLDEEQQEAADEVLAGMKAVAKPHTVYSLVERATRFYSAEEYHQHFIEKRNKESDLG